MASMRNQQMRSPSAQTGMYGDTMEDEEHWEGWEDDDDGVFDRRPNPSLILRLPVPQGPMTAHGTPRKPLTGAETRLARMYGLTDEQYEDGTHFGRYHWRHKWAHGGNPVEKMQTHQMFMMRTIGLGAFGDFKDFYSGALYRARWIWTEVGKLADMAMFFKETPQKSLPPADWETYRAQIERPLGWIDIMDMIEFDTVGQGARSEWGGKRFRTFTDFAETALTLCNNAMLFNKQGTDAYERARRMADHLQYHFNMLYVEEYEMSFRDRYEGVDASVAPVIRARYQCPMLQRVNQLLTIIEHCPMAELFLTPQTLPEADSAAYNEAISKNEASPRPGERMCIQWMRDKVINGGYAYQDPWPAVRSDLIICFSNARRWHRTEKRSMDDTKFLELGIRGIGYTHRKARHCAEMCMAWFVEGWDETQARPGQRSRLETMRRLDDHPDPMPAADGPAPSPPRDDGDVPPEEPYYSDTEEGRAAKAADAEAADNLFGSDDDSDGEAPAAGSGEAGPSSAGVDDSVDPLDDASAIVEVLNAMSEGNRTRFGKWISENEPDVLTRIDTPTGLILSVSAHLLTWRMLRKACTDLSIALTDDELSQGDGSFFQGQRPWMKWVADPASTYSTGLRPQTEDEADRIFRQHAEGFVNHEARRRAGLTKEQREEEDAERDDREKVKDRALAQAALKGDAPMPER